MPLDQHIASALNRRLDSPLRVEVDDVRKTAGTGQVNLTSLADEIQTALEALESATDEQLARPMVSEDGFLRIEWHARRRREGEEAEPVIT